MSKIKYHCEICDQSYDTEEEARKCEIQGAQPFLFEVGDSFKPIERPGFQSTYQPTHPKKIKIIERRRAPRNHENLYVVGPWIGKARDVLGESYLKGEFEKINT